MYKLIWGVLKQNISQNKLKMQPIKGNKLVKKKMVEDKRLIHKFKNQRISLIIVL